MDAPRSEPASARYDELHAEAAEALAFAANTLRGIRDRYRSTYLEELARWDVLRDDLVAFEREDGEEPSGEPSANGTSAHGAAEAGAADLRLRMLRGDTEQGRIDLGRHETELSRLELGIRNLESTWLFLERGDSSLVTDAQLPAIPTELQMRIVEAQEAERARLAQEVHDGPAQALSNAIFQVEFIDRVFDSRPADGPHRAPVPARAPPPRAGRRAELHRPAAAARPRGARPGRLDHGHGGHAGRTLWHAHRHRARCADRRP